MRGYRVICIHDVTFDSTESARLPGIRSVGYDRIASTAEVLTHLVTDTQSACG